MLSHSCHWFVREGDISGESQKTCRIRCFIVLGNKDDKKEKIIAIVFINSNIYEATDVRDVCCRVAFIMFMKK